jgi:hypothetical protein
MAVPTLGQAEGFPILSSEEVRREQPRALGRQEGLTLGVGAQMGG